MLSVENIDFFQDDVDEIAFKVLNRYVCVQNCEDGYDYSIFREDFSLEDGGIFDDSNATMMQVIREILADILIDEFLKGNVINTSKIIKVDYDTILEKNLLVETRRVQDGIIEEYKKKVESNFRPICGMCQEQVIVLARDYLQEKIESYDLDARITNVVIVGSRSRGIEMDSSDLDFLVEYVGNAREDFLFNIAHEDDFCIGNVLVDINPINIERTGQICDREDIKYYPTCKK